MHAMCFGGHAHVTRTDYPKPEVKEEKLESARMQGQVLDLLEHLRRDFVQCVGGGGGASLEPNMAYRHT